jgi:hypothetical protein
MNPDAYNWDPDRWGPGMWHYAKRVYKTTTTNTTQPEPQGLTEADIRRIVREEMADIVSVDVPDYPPEG